MIPGDCRCWYLLESLEGGLVTTLGTVWRGGLATTLGTVVCVESLGLIGMCSTSMFRSLLVSFLGREVFIN